MPTIEIEFTLILMAGEESGANRPNTRYFNFLQSYLQQTGTRRWVPLNCLKGALNVELCAPFRVIHPDESGRPNPLTQISCLGEIVKNLMFNQAHQKQDDASQHILQ